MQNKQVYKLGVICMAKSLISSVSFGSYNKVSFDGRWKKSPENGYSTRPLKAIPLAVIIAMSPMVNEACIYAETHQINNIEQDDYKFEQKGKIIAAQPYDLNDGSWRTCVIFFESTDDNNEDIEAVRVVFNKQENGFRYIGNEKVNYKRNKLDELYIQGMEILNTTVQYDDGSENKYRTYYILGPLKYTKEPAISTDGTSRIVDKSAYIREFENGKYEIPENLYNYIKGLLGKQIKYSESSIIEKYTKSGEPMF